MSKSYPVPIYSNQPGTWSYSTVTRRLPEIAGRVIQENDFTDAINQKLIKLQDEINHETVRLLLDQAAPDQEDWNGYLEPYLGKNWLEVPWLLAEHYFYRRIMEAVDFFNRGQDPFHFQKLQGLEKSRDEILALGKYLQENLPHRTRIKDTMLEGIYFSLWGNQADLSLWPAGSENNPAHRSRTSHQDHLLADDAAVVVDLLTNTGQVLPRVDLLLDNAGFELITDLALAEILLTLGLVQQVYLLAKAHPTFVSDVIPVDIGGAIDYLVSLDDAAASSFGTRLNAYLESGQMVIREHFFWNSPLAMWELPDDIRLDWQSSSLVISKGDANYRRLLGDRQWDFTLPFPEVVDYLPLPLAALRTLKAELAAGLDAEKIRVVEKQDPTWMVDGRWGLVQFAEKGSI